MSISKVLISYLFTALVFFSVDMLWLGVIAKDVYRKYLGALLSDQVNWTAAIIFYLLYIIGILVFAVYPSIQKDSLISSAIFGALFGFFTYATYDLTNYATLKGWPIQIVIIDIFWGALLSAIVSLAGFYIVKAIH